jgi:hypothetical protein
MDQDPDVLAAFSIIEGEVEKWKVREAKRRGGK